MTLDDDLWIWRNPHEFLAPDDRERRLEYLEAWWWAYRMKGLATRIWTRYRQEIESGARSWTGGPLHYRDPINWPWMDWERLAAEAKLLEAVRLAAEVSKHPVHAFGHEITSGAVVLRTMDGRRRVALPEAKTIGDAKERRRMERLAVAPRLITRDWLSVEKPTPEDVLALYDPAEREEAEPLAGMFSGLDAVALKWHLEPSRDWWDEAGEHHTRAALVFLFTMRVGPIVVDERRREAYRYHSGLIRVMEFGTDPERVKWITPPPEAAASWWATGDEWPVSDRLRKVISDFISTAPAITTTTTTTTTPRPEEVRYLLDGPTRIDKEAEATVDELALVDLKRWWKVKPLAEWEAEEFARLSKDRQAAERDKLLEEVHQAKGSTLKLTNKAKRLLKRRLADKGTAYLVDVGQGRFLARSVRVSGSETIEVGMSWRGRPELLAQVAREQSATRARKALEEIRAKPLLAPELAGEADRLRRWLEELGSAPEALKIIRYVLAEFGAMGHNPVEIPHWTLAKLLDYPDNHLDRVKTALTMLVDLHVMARTNSSNEEYGTLVGHWSYTPRGAGESTDGDWRIWLNARAYRCLGVFRIQPPTASAKPKRTPPPKITRAATPEPTAEEFDFNRDLEKEQREQLNYSRYQTKLLAFLPAAWRLDDHEARLLEFIVRNLTHRSKGRDKGSSPPELRTYGPEDCPLLDGGGWVGAMGYGKNAVRGDGWWLARAETPRTKTGGSRPPGLVQAVRLPWPPGQAVDERRRSAAVVLRMLRTLVEDKLGGRVVGKSVDRWLSVADAERMLTEARIGVDELAAIRWRIYLAADWLDRCRSAIKHHHEAARERGDVAYRVEITTDRAVAKAAEDNRGLALPASAATTTASLRERLLAARKRRGLSQEAAGRLFDVSQKAWAAWENGSKPIPRKRADTLARWASEDIQDGQ